jgi:rhodanese-related sulfurtransferase
MKTILLTCLISILLIVIFAVIKKRDPGTQISETVPPGPYTLIDVRNHTEVEAQPYPDAIHIPLSDLESRYKELKGISGTLVLFCRSGNRSGQAIHFLKKKDITNTFNGINIDKLKTFPFLNKM